MKTNLAKSSKNLLSMLSNAVDNLGTRKPAFIKNMEGISLVEETIRQHLRSDAQLLTDISEYLLHLGGKRIRPLLCLTSAKLFGMKTPSEELISAAAGIELIHMATLLHDDIIDKSATRRSNKSAYSKWGLAPTLLSGDFLLVKAFGLCAQLDEFVVKATEKACVELTEGELLEGTLNPSNPIALEDYISVVGKKTASLFQLSAGVGAHLAHASVDETKQLAQFGQLSGIAFQMIDDILDVTSSESVLGKPIGTDLKQKTPSLVNLLWLNVQPHEAHEFFSIPAPEDHQVTRAVSAIKESTAIVQAREMAAEFASKAIAEIKELSSSYTDLEVRKQLIDFVHFTLKRCL